MPKRIAPLTDIQVSKAKTKPAQYAMRDGGGLYLVVTPTGGKLWRYDYRYEGKRLTLSMGVYPTLSLADARLKRGEAQQQIANGINPNTVKKILRTVKTTENSFEAIAREWHAKFEHTWCEKHGFHKLQRLESNIFPWVGKTDIAELAAPDLLAALRIIEARGASDLASRVRTTCVQIFQYAIATGRCQRNVAMDLKGALVPYTAKHYGAITDPKELAGFMRALDGYQGQFVTQCAIRLQVMLLVRPGELRHMEWSEIDGDMWNIPAHKMKMKIAHLVPLPTQAVAVLKQLRHVTGHTRFVFPSMVSNQRPMSDNTVNTALRRMGYGKDEVTGHGFRATARTILDEVLKVRVDLIEHQLAHAVRDVNGRAYNRTSFTDDRKIMMQQWADYLEGLPGILPVTACVPAQ